MLLYWLMKGDHLLSVPEIPDFPLKTLGRFIYIGLDKIPYPGCDNALVLVDERG